MYVSTHTHTHTDAHTGSLANVAVNKYLSF